MLTPPLTPQDNFNNDSLNTVTWTAWNTGAAGVETGHAYRITPHASQAEYAGLNSNHRFDLTGKRASVQVLQALNAGSSETTFWLYLDDTNKVGIQITGTVIQAYRDVAGSESWTNGVTYNPAAHRYLGISEDAGVLSWEWSTDGIRWTALRSEATPIAVTNLEYRVFAGTWDTSNASPGTAIFDNVNLVPQSTKGFLVWLSVREPKLLMDVWRLQDDES